MSLLVAFLHEGMQPLGQMGFVPKIRDRQALPLENAEPLFHRIHPRATHRRMVEPEAGMVFQPRLHLLSSVHSQVVHHQVNRRDLGRNFAVQFLQELDKLLLPFPLCRVGTDMSGPGIEGREQVQSSFAFVLVFHMNRLA